MIPLRHCWCSFVSLCFNIDDALSPAAHASSSVMLSLFLFHLSIGVSLEVAGKALKSTEYSVGSMFGT